LAEPELRSRYGGLPFFSGQPVVIAGPCSVEDEEQIVTTAVSVRRSGAVALRGGAYKPRTLPASFQGLGQEGLRLLALARERSGLPVVTEVMDTQEIDGVAEYADVLQIGARNMHNFALLRQVGRAGRPVLLKRGLCATLTEWLGAAEYVTRSGNDRVILCERGIRTFETATRNTLALGTALLARERSGFPLVVDPSHAAGRRDLVPALCRAALAAGADGLIVEVHPDPPLALSDPDQQLDLEAFARLMQDLGLRPADAMASLEECRQAIDRLDDAILSLLSRRLAAVERVGTIKRRDGMAARQPRREASLLARLSRRADSGLAPDEVVTIWQAVLAVSRRRQEAGTAHADRDATARE
jgi:3-deoxy-7-phosphoheptulonate synthase